MNPHQKMLRRIWLYNKYEILLREIVYHKENHIHESMPGHVLCAVSEWVEDGTNIGDWYEAS